MNKPGDQQTHSIPESLPIHSAQRPDNLLTPLGHRWALLHANHAQARLVDSSRNLHALKPYLDPGASNHAPPDELHLVSLLPPFQPARPGILHHPDTPIHAEAEYLNPSTLESTACSQMPVDSLPSILRTVANALQNLQRSKYSPHPSHLHYLDTEAQCCFVSPAGALLAATIASGMHHLTILPGQLPPSIASIVMAADCAFHGNFAHAQKILVPSEPVPAHIPRQQELFRLRMPCLPQHCLTSNGHLLLYTEHLANAAPRLEIPVS